MRVVKLERYVVDEIVLRNSMKLPQTKLQLKNRFRYQVKYPKGDDKRCVGELALEIGDADADTPLYLAVRLRGIFLVEAPDKRRVHVESFYQLFPYARSILTNTCAMSCLPPLMFPTPDLQEENIDINFQS